MYAKICGIKDPDTLNYIINHKHPPKFIGFITNYIKSKRYVGYENLKNLLKVNKKGIKFVSVLVNPDNKILNKIKSLNFDYYQLYDVSPLRTKEIKDKYKIKIISAITIKNNNDLDKYKGYKNISEIVLFDGIGYEKSLGFNHKIVKNVPKSICRMIAGNINYKDRLDKYKKIADIIDISGSLETLGSKDISKINVFLENIKKLNDEN